MNIFANMYDHILLGAQVAISLITAAIIASAVYSALRAQKNKAAIPHDS